EGPVRPGAKWTARGRSVMDALFGSTDMALLAVPDDSFQRAFWDVLMRQFRNRFENEIAIDCAYSGRSLAPQAQLARIDLRWHATDVFDATAEFNERRDPQSPLNFLGKVDSLRIEWKVESTGTLLWSTAENRFDSLKLDAAVQLDMVCEIPTLLGYTKGEGNPWVWHQTSQGKATWSMTAKRKT
ncbi:MAG: hypothetical protein ABI054_04090, partial [Planctomycetota bacterium]